MSPKIGDKVRWNNCPGYTVIETQDSQGLYGIMYITGQRFWATLSELSQDSPVTAMRHNEGKPQLRYVLCFPKANAALAKTCEIGAAKYELYNFMLPTPVSRSVECLLRHLTALWNGELVDAEGNPHIGAMRFNVDQIAENLETEMDDRPCNLKGKKCSK